MKQTHHYLGNPTSMKIFKPAGETLDLKKSHDLKIFAVESFL